MLPLPPDCNWKSRREKLTLVETSTPQTYTHLPSFPSHTHPHCIRIKCQLLGFFICLLGYLVSFLFAFLIHCVWIKMQEVPGPALI